MLNILKISTIFVMKLNQCGFIVRSSLDGRRTLSELFKNTD